MNLVSILSLATVTPPHILSQAEALDTARDLIGGNFADFERLSAVYANAGIQHRQLAMPVDWYRSPRSFPERTAAYLDVALDLFVAAAQRALAEADVRPQDVHTIVTISSTGIATPSLEARAMSRLPFRSDVARVPVFGLGCAGGASGLSLASKLARATPGSTVLFVTVELCSLALRIDKADKADIISTALFGDGAAACVLRSGEEGFVQISGSAEKTWSDTLDIMGWQAEPTGLGVVLNRAIPIFARREMRQAMTEMLAPQGLSIEDVDQFICHPGGAKVVDAIEAALSLDQGALAQEREVLRDHGNMSAPTVLFVLDRYRQAGLPPLSVLNALGPGFTASSLTLRCAA
ncbi:putative Type III polyketide synthase [Novosphingobium sp. Rr 2-17]|uniref:type III polyketide synthase n=1 Tax=Novosphingobium sp. Rr 2-17 TaxID=555793 RepID=UPI0002698B90|nr:3-oxoacyl-[acyl-carrier-protein] synthase III C-terminal domain-containing protein [Novosphingobium sp. Rr 2-17]EIZ80055.1 putative Type III polyketide synthase [Novosphingobium sp. Rr 2-17]